MKKKNNRNETTEAKPSMNREFTVITYLFLFLFLALMGYFVYFQVFESETFINSPYNSLQNLFSDRVIRGEIKTSDGYVVAKTTVSSDGTEQREYPYDNLFAHVVGYSTNGKAGLESQANFSLLRSHSFFLEQFVRDFKDEKNIGDNVVSTLRYDLQSTAYQALGKYDGAVIVMEPSSGKILAMVSKPDYNPNTVLANWEALTADGSTVLFNRATQGKYAPGSIFKILTTLEYYRENPDDYDKYSYDCDGAYIFENQTIHCAANEKHGKEDLCASFANSCNSSYANLSLTLKQNEFQKTCNSLLFNKNLPVAFESGKSTFSISDKSNNSLIMQTGIGQGETLVSPLHMLMITSAIANDGILMTPYLIDHVDNKDGTTIETTSPKEYGALLSEKEAHLLQGYMHSVVEDGTARKLKGQSYEAYGKTGSAQVSDTTDQTNAWFVGYAHQNSKNDIALAVIVEDSGFGSTYAVPIAKQIFQAYYQ